MLIISEASGIKSKIWGLDVYKRQALYRAVAYDMLENRIDPSDIHAVCERLAHITVRLGYENGDQQIYLNGKNITEKIRTPQISAAASTVSSLSLIHI